MATKVKPPVAEQPNYSSTKCKKSWKAVTAAEHYLHEGRYGKALALLFKYEDCEARAMLMLAYMYYKGLGVVEDMKKAVLYLQKLAAFEDFRPGEEALLATALYYLGELYYRGIAVAKDDVEAERCWVRGAVLQKDPETGFHYYGSVQCQTALGMFYSNPLFKNAKKAFYWHKKASESGSDVSEGALGVMYMHGIGTEVKLELAYVYLVNATIKGNIFAKGHLAAFCYRRQMYHRTVTLGRELASEEDLESLARERECPLEHVKQGIALGCFYLALCMQQGLEIAQNIQTAKELIKKAIQLSPDIAYDLHSKAILGMA
ncbi:LRP2-binding protein-like [Stegodyphus dumicola]|uniref:LRP2-binding protein-like n=1 Tax=Stegodyphus dumicola TaxID=202533 RepID=UPI0015B0275C|nr:LRP2-binding protein-like [Stegodyphus dumicola]XP_035228986.1 LRP2-binding protein-like [Stegodyphus dumicola]